MTGAAARGVRDFPSRRSRSAACRPQSRTARPTAITTAPPRWLAPGDLLDQPQATPPTGRNIRCPSLTYHEGVPGHHLQISLAQEAGHADAAQDRLLRPTPKAGRSIPSSSPRRSAAITGIERAGYLQAFLFRVGAAGGRHRPQRQGLEPREGGRLDGAPPASRARASQREIERYSLAGQACSYKVGHLAWLRARDSAKKIPGCQVRHQGFHEVLKDGAMPLTILQRRVEAARPRQA